MKTELRISRSILLPEFASVVQALSIQTKEKFAQGICLDSRVLKPGDLFFAIQGERDGHEFVRQALDAGASACVVSKDVSVENVIRVNDTMESLWQYAAWVRSQWGKKIIALSGSNGKTSTKEMIATLLGDDAHKTPGTWNSLLGVPLTLLLLEPRHDCAVVEMGINDFGELSQMCRYTKPNIAMLTNIGPAHLEKLGDLNGVSKAKSEIFSCLQPEDTAVLNIDDPYIEKMKSTLDSQILTVSKENHADIQCIEKKYSEGYDLKVRYGDEEISVHLPLSGEHNVSNYLCALGTVKAIGVGPDKIVQRTPGLQPVQMRMETIRLADRIIVNDCYNANPGSFSAVLDAVSNMQARHRILLAGDMLELGADSEIIHRDLGKTFSTESFDWIFVTGRYASEIREGALEAGFDEGQVFVEDKESLSEKVLSKFGPGDILLAKASRGLGLENVLDQIQQVLKG